jgi:superfamily I DNA/RNA helicase
VLSLPQVVETVDGHAEADWLAAALRRLERHGHDLREAAVLFRVHLLSRVIEQALVRPLLLPPQWLW